MLSTAGELFMLAVDARGVPRCEAWRIDTAEGVLSHDDGDVRRSLKFTSAGSHLELGRFQRIAPDLSESTSCVETHTVRELDGALDLDGMRWFATAAGCAASIARHAPVATTFACAIDEPVAERPRATTQRRFEAIVARGGAMYAAEDGACKRVGFRPERGHPRDHYTGELSYRVRVDDRRGVESYGYELDRGSTTMTLLGPGTEYDDGSAEALGCMEVIELDYRADHVALLGDLYFDRAACRKAVARSRARARWLPDPDPAATTIATPLLGGC